MVAITLCACGLRGCLEMVAPGPATARIAREALGHGEPSVLPAGVLSAEHVYCEVAQGDALSLRVAGAAGEHLARAIRALAILLGVRPVVVGGSTRAGEAFSRPLHRHLEIERAAADMVRRAMPEHLVILPPDVEATAWWVVTVARAGFAPRTWATTGRRAAGS